MKTKLETKITVTYYLKKVSLKKEVKKKPFTLQLPSKEQ